MPSTFLSKENFVAGDEWLLGVPVEDLTLEIFGENPSSIADLAALKADGTYGDGNLAYNGGADFGSGEFITLADASTAHYASSIWVAGAAP